MTKYQILVQARNRALATDPSPEQRVLYELFQSAIDHFPNVSGYDIAIAYMYTRQPPTKEK